MSINVTVSGNPINIRRGRVVLSDLDQIKKNERDRRRRLRLEQVRQQSKEISSRLLERAKNIAQHELEKLEKDEKSELKRLHDRKIMEIQQKYREEMENIGQAHAAAVVETEALITLGDETEKNREAALRRGKEAFQQLQRQDKDDLHAMHQQRLQQVRKLENKRSSLVVKLSKKSGKQDETDKNLAEEDGTSVQEDERNESLQKSTKKKKLKRLVSKKSPGKITRVTEKGNGGSQKNHDGGCSKKCTTTNIPERTREDIYDAIYIDHAAEDGESPRESVPTLSTSAKAEKIARYNPGDYVQDSSDSVSNDSPSSLSDDSSYFSDVCEQSTCNRTPKHHTSLADSKVQLYDHTTRQRNMYNRPLDVVERLDIRNEPNAVDAARKVQRTESIESHVTENHKLASQKRGDDAILREKVRSDYKILIQHLDHLSSEERKLKASEMQNNPMNDVHLRKSRRKELQKEQTKKLNRAFEAIADKGSSSSHPNFTERIITLTPLQQSGDRNKISEGAWKEPHFVDAHTPVTKSSKSKEMSREELILDMLKKVERQKRLLLEEFGTSLPDDIYRASITSLTEPEKPDAPQNKLQQQTPPEVTSINMSSGEDSKNSKKPRKKSTTKKCEIAVQTSTLQDVGIAEDKGVQVELIEAKSDTNTKSDNNVISTESDVPSKHYPIEPKITVINPEIEDSSSSSTNSVLSGVTIDIDNKGVKVTPKKKKGVLKVSKRTSVKNIQKSQSAPPSKTSSPVKRYSKSLPSSCHSSPRKINIHIKRNGLNVNVDPLCVIKPSIDSSTDSSPLYSSLNTQDSSVSKPYEVQTKSKRAIKIGETSDTSTSFASPPFLAPKRNVIVTSNITPILEMLDSSHNGIEKTKMDISPISTPETPSPRTINMPSNVIHSEKISKILRYDDSERIDDTTESFSKKDTHPTFYPRKDKILSGHRAYTPHSSMLSSPCSCRNPNCKLLHSQFEDIQNFALKNCPEILKKYEHLQNMCTERIASLSDLIDKVRSEQRGMELSVMCPHDETSFQPKVQSDLQSVQRLVESIEAIHKQLTETLRESQKTITVNESINQDMSKDMQSQLENSKNKSKVEHPVSTANEHTVDNFKAKSKPRIIKEEKVNIKLNRFKMSHKPSAIMTMVTPERNSWPPTKMPVQENNIIKEISKEILEQSKNLDKSSITFKKLGNIKNTDVKDLLKKSDDSKPSTPSKSESNDVPVQKESINLQPTKDIDFEPILAGIPKMLPISANGRINGKNKPPVSLQSGYFRTEVDSMGHELSTIIEFDTPDTANKSNTNIKNSKAKSLVMDESYAEKSAVKKSVEVQTTKSSVIVKPSVHVAPLPVQDPVHKISPLPSSSMKKSPTEMLTSQLQEAATECNLSRKTYSEMHHEYGITNDPVGLLDSVKEKVNKQLQCNTSDPEKKQVQQICDQISCVSDKGKVSSSSSNSFYELSGISEITSTPSSSLFKYASPIEEMETELKKLGLNWAATILKKTREASALSSSSNSDITPLNTARRIISPTKKHIDPNIGNLLDFSDVSSISIKEASKSTEQAVLLKGRTSTPKLQNSNSNSDKSNSVASNSSGISFQEPSDSLTVPNVSLIKTKTNVNQCKGP
ncbi:hypothetical protein KPH14_003541 [Odynerus spinipes]|uniref:Uncharacterized protein n=1 Tax=Odynerus spinipes TaxID=1348599 RepID=A0AAD9RD29_9HYME|nr:hypothetical protein KPH14_003541 [Odynerus spinipes]